MLPVTLKGVIFDMDGTLLYTLDDIVDSINDTLLSWNLPVRTTQELLVYIGYGARHLCQGASGLEGEKLDEFHRQYRQRALLRTDSKTRVYPGIEALVYALKAHGIKVGIYTNKPQPWTEKLAARYFKPDAFDAIVGVREGGWIKPEPGGIFDICAQWHVEVKNTVMVGDSPVDIETAHNAGIAGLGCTWGFRTRQQLESASADVLIDDAWALGRVLLGNEYLP